MRLRLPHLPRELLLVVAAGCVLVAVFLALVAVDVARSRSAIPADDVRFAAGAPTSGWSPRALAPFGAGERTLGVRDDVAFRHMLRTLRASRLLDYTVSDPMLAIKRTELAERLESIAVHDPDPTLRSRASEPARRRQRRLVELDSVAGDAAARPLRAPARGDRELRAGDRTRPRERRREVQPAADAAAGRGSAADRGRSRQEPGRGRQGIQGRRRRRARQRVLMELTLLTPLGALIALGVVVPLVALALLHRRGRVGATRDRTARAPAVGHSRRRCGPRGRGGSARAGGRAAAARVDVRAARARRRGGDHRARHVTVDAGANVAAVADPLRAGERRGAAVPCRLRGRAGGHRLVHGPRPPASLSEPGPAGLRRDAEPVARRSTVRRRTARSSRPRPGSRRWRRSSAAASSRRPSATG